MNFGSGFGSSPFGQQQQQTSAFGMKPSAFGQSGLGAGASPFGQTQTGAANPSPFGQSSPTAPFGSPRPAGGSFSQPSNANPVGFGAPQAGGASAFGVAASPTFGQAPGVTTPGAGLGAFGSGGSVTPFGSTQTNAFGARPTTSAFGSTTPAFGATAQVSGFGGSPGTASPFGVSGQQQGFGFGGASSPAFGQAGQPSVFGGGGAFGQQPATAVGTKQLAYQVTQESEAAGNSSTVVKYQSISFMPSYRTKSVEELRWEDYQNGVKGGQGNSAMGQGTGGFGFGQNTLGGTMGAFGMSAGAQTSSLSSPFGASSQPAFGASSSTTTQAFGATTTTGGFGSQSVPAFGASQPAFGGAAGAPAFGATTPQTGGFGFGAATAQSSPAFGSGGAFGQQPAASAFGMPSAASSPFGATTTTPAFGGITSPTQPFGTASGFGSGGSKAPAGFGASPTSAFGTSSTPTLGAASAPAFGASTPSFSLGGGTAMPAFGASAPAQSSFGGFGTTATQPAFGASSSAAFGTSASQPSFGGFGTSSLGSSAPAFSLSPASTSALSGGLFGQTSAFGASLGSQPSSPSLFNMSTSNTAGTATNSQAFGIMGQAQPSTSLFGGNTGNLGTTPTFGNLGGNVGLTTNSNTPAMGTGQQLSTLSPYGGLPAPPVVGTPNSATLLSRQAPQRSITYSATNLMATRTIVPRSSIRIRPRRSKEPSSISSPQSFFYTADDNSNETLNDGAFTFRVRENPRKLFLRKLPPSTELSLPPNPDPENKVIDGNKIANSRGDVIKGRVTFADQNEVKSSEQQTHLVNGKDLTVVTPQPIRAGFNISPEESKHDPETQSPASLAEIVPYLSPQSQRNGYYTLPRQETLTQQARSDPDFLSHVPDFVVGRDGFGKCKWKGEVDVKGLKLSEIVVFEKQDSKPVVTVYPNERDKPPQGFGLNRAAEVTLYDVFLMKDGSKVLEGPLVEKFTARLKSVEGTTFVRYSAEEGEWVFVVEHFSKYTVPDDDVENDDDDDEKVHDVTLSPLPVFDPDDYEDEEMNEMNFNIKESMSSPLVHTLPRSLGLNAEEMYSMRSVLFDDREEKAGIVTIQDQPLISVPVQRDDTTSERSIKPLLPKPNPRLDLLSKTQAHRDPIPTSRNLIDTGLHMRQSFRVGWGPGGLLVHSASPPSTMITSIAYEQNVANSIGNERGHRICFRHVVPKSFTYAEDYVAMQRFFRSTVELHTKVSESALDMDGFAHWRVTVDTVSLVEVCKKFVDLWRPYLNFDIGIQVNSFIKTIVLLKNLVEEDDSNEMITWDLRRRARMGRWLSDWNEEVLRDCIHNLPDESTLRVFYLLVGRDLPLASSTAARNGDFRLSTLVAQGGVSLSGKRSIQQQIHIWEREKFTTYIDEDRIRIYHLLSGNVAQGINRLPLDWRSAFAAYFWYGASVHHSLIDTIALYEEDYKAGKAPTPIPNYEASFNGVYDIDFYLMQVRGANERLVRSMLTPRSASNDPLDFHLQWLLGTLLRPLGICSMGSALHSVTIGMAYQLELLGHIDLAVYVLATTPPSEDLLWIISNKKAIRDFISRHAEFWLQNPDKIKFLVDIVLIPAEWFAESLAHLAHYQKDPRREVSALIAAGLYNDAHKLFLLSIAPRLILDGQLANLLPLLLAMEEAENEIENWLLGGGLLLQFAKIDQLLEEEQTPSLLEDDITDLCSLIARGAELWSSETKHSSVDRSVVQAAFAELLRHATSWLDSDAFLSPSCWSWLQRAQEGDVVSHVQHACERLCYESNFFEHV